MAQLQKILGLLMLLVPRQLPQTDRAFEALVARVTAAAGVPLNDGLINAIGAQLMQLGAQTAFITDMYFYLSIKRAVASQTAYNAIEAVRARDKAARLAASNEKAE